MRVRGMLVAAILFALTACATPAPRLPVPDRAAVERVVVTRERATGGDHAVVLDDSKAVERLLDFVRGHNDGWERTWHTFPSPQITARLMQGDELLLVLWVGTNWLGGRESGHDDQGNRLRSLSDGERAELLDILGIPAEAAPPHAAR